MGTEKWGSDTYEITKYSYGGLWIAHGRFPQITVRQIEEMAEKDCPWFSINEWYAGVSYEGNDRGRFVVEFLRQVAPLIGKATSRIWCQALPDIGDFEPEFLVEYFGGYNGRLYRQKAVVTPIEEPQVF